MDDADWMQRALAVAERGRGRTYPNPFVGCVIVQGDQVFEGFTSPAGGSHAEVHAVRAAHQAGVSVRGARVFVTLEPCAHHGRTPPCAEMLVREGVSHVTIATLDPNPNVSGKGVAILRAAGIEVSIGLLEPSAQRQQEVFRTNMIRKRPWVLYKSAMTLDGKIATSTGHSQWVSGDASRARVQRWRDEYDGIAVGIGTVLQDNPHLTTRLSADEQPRGRTPTKVIFDSHLRTPITSRLFEPDASGTPAKVVIVTTEQGADARAHHYTERATLLVVPKCHDHEQTDVSTALRQLLPHVSALLLEGGGTLAWSFLMADAVDKVAFFIAPKLIGGSGPTPLGGEGQALMHDALSLTDVQTEMIGDDVLLTGYKVQA